MNASQLDVFMCELGWVFQYGQHPLSDIPSRIYQGTYAAAPRTDVINLLVLAGMRVVRPDLITTSNQIHVFL